MTADKEKYLSQFSDVSTYACALDLVRRNSASLTSQHDSNSEPAIFLDLACGGGPLAGPVEQQLGLTYVGVDLEGPWLRGLTDSGFEAHAADLSMPFDVALDRVTTIIGERRVAAISMLDGLEHLVDSESVLRLIATISQRHHALSVFSVPNVAHRDVGIKLALGRWDYTDTGLLDTTHVRFFTAESLTTALKEAGLHVVEKADLHLKESDQHFPVTHPALSASSSVGQLYRAVRDGADANATVNQFVWLCLPGPAVVAGTVDDGSQEAAGDEPFLSVVVRTQGKRKQELRECLLSLTAQTTSDFEVLVMAHDTTAAGAEVVDRAVRELPDGLRERVQVIEVTGGGRARPLNIGFGNARGEYCVVLDDDDFVMAHWAQSFKDLHASHPGTLLRTRCAVQSHTRIETLGVSATTATSALSMPYDSDFSLAKHMVMNQTPFMTVAFPRALFVDLDYRFDETLTTTEDWDYLLRAAALVGVTSSPEVTAVYRRWNTVDTSYSQHAEDEWRLNHAIVERKLDQLPLLLQPGEAAHIRRFVKMAYNIRDADTPVALAQDYSRLALLQEAILVLTSRRWRYSRPLRLPSELLLRRRPVNLSSLATMSADEISNAIDQVRRSRSWNVWPSRAPVER